MKISDELMSSDTTVHDHQEGTPMHTFASREGVDAVLNAPEAPAISGEAYLMALNASDFHTVLTALVTAFEEGDDDAGALASGIAQSLGVEWV